MTASNRIPEAADAVLRFLTLRLADEQAGVVRPDQDYPALFPGFEQEIEDEQHRLRGARMDGEEGRKPRRLGPYALLEELGRGGQAVVYLARDERIPRLVALKVLRATAIADPRQRLRLQREAEALARLNHHAVAAVHEHGELEGMPYLALERIEGRNLSDWLQRTGHGLEPKRVARMGHALAGGLDALHRAGVLHRDVKPSNVVVGDDDRPVLVDLGLALEPGREGSQLTRTGEQVGTPAYLPPEVLLGDGSFDERGDVYMLGATLFEALTGRSVHVAATGAALMERVRSEEAPDVRSLRREVPRDLSTVVSTALHRDPARRYADAAAMQADLGRVVDGQPIEARHVGPAARAWRRIRSRPVLSCVVTALIVLLATTTAVSSRLLVAERRSTSHIQRLADARSITHLVRRAERELGFLLPEHVPVMDGWLAQAEGVLDRLEREPPPRRAGPSFPGRPRMTGAGRVEELRQAVALVRAQRAVAATLRQESLVRHRVEWERALAEIGRDPRYGGLSLAPQLGLVPLGRDPESGLQEFGHIATGTVPPRDATTGRLRVEEDTGLVLVLIPGGSFLQGAEGPLPGGLGDPDPDEGPTERIRLDPYFLSKFEMTQGQWLRATGENPSRWRPGSDARHDVDLRHPVEKVNWRGMARTLERIGLELPTEAQWEYAARAGTATPWWTGASPTSLAGAANLADLTVLHAGLDWIQAVDLPELEDCWIEHAPVGSFRANAFGLHDVVGNLWETCRDVHARYDASRAAPGSGERLVPGSGPDHPRVVRGGAYDSSPWRARSSSRGLRGTEARNSTGGLRPGRSIQRQEALEEAR